MPPEQRGLDPDTAFELLSNERRRHVLCLLAQHDGELSLRTVTTEIIARLEDADPDEIDESTYRSVYVSLYQNHVPRLADAGVIHYDVDERTVRIAHDRRTRELLQLAGVECQPPWHRNYLLVLGVTVATALATFGDIVRAFDPWVLPAVVLIGGLAVLAGHQYYTRNRIAVSDCGVLRE